jgi:RNA polymerase sigma factor (TIGR02999 family)
MLALMADVTEVLVAVDQGDPRAAAELLPLIYDELRKLAAAKLGAEAPGQTLQATALVHEAYLRLVGSGQRQDWGGRGHFFAAAAEAMRRILVDRARRKKAEKHGGGRRRENLDETCAVGEPPSDDVLAVHQAVAELEARDPLKARIVLLRYFAGLSMEETAAALGLPGRTLDRHWRYLRAWLLQRLG